MAFKKFRKFSLDTGHWKKLQFFILNIFLLLKKSPFLSGRESDPPRSIGLSPEYAMFFTCSLSPRDPTWKKYRVLDPPLLPF